MNCSSCSHFTRLSNSGFCSLHQFVVLEDEECHKWTERKEPLDDSCHYEKTICRYVRTGDNIPFPKYCSKSNTPCRTPCPFGMEKEEQK